jgi:hypothetical protein
MRPLFAVHAGELSVGQYIEQSFKGKNVWIPTKDTGGPELLFNRLFKSGLPYCVWSNCRNRSPSPSERCKMTATFVAVDASSPLK